MDPVALRTIDIDVEVLKEICQRYGIAELYVFGSAARDALEPSSDIDLLYRLVPGTRLGWEIEDLNQELEDLLGRPVDLVSVQAIHPRLADTIKGEMRHLYAA